MIIHTYSADKTLLGLGEPGDEVEVVLEPFRDGFHRLVVIVNGTVRVTLNDVKLGNVRMTTAKEVTWRTR